MNKQKSIIAALAILFAGQAFALEISSSDYIEVDIANATDQPEQMRLTHTSVAEMREHGIAAVEHGFFRPFACTLKGAGVTAHITARDQAEADWTANAMREQGATAKIITTVDPDAPEVKIDVARSTAEPRDPACAVITSGPTTAPEVIYLQHEFVRDFEAFYDRYGVDNLFVRDGAKTLRTPAITSVNITARDQAEADLVAFTYRRYGATAPFTTAIDPAIAEVKLDIVKVEK